MNDSVGQKVSSFACVEAKSSQSQGEVSDRSRRPDSLGWLFPPARPRPSSQDPILDLIHSVHSTPFLFLRGLLEPSSPGPCGIEKENIQKRRGRPRKSCQNAVPGKGLPHPISSEQPQRSTDCKPPYPTQGAQQPAANGLALFLTSRSTFPHLSLSPPPLSPRLDRQRAANTNVSSSSPPRPRDSDSDRVSVSTSASEPVEEVKTRRRCSAPAQLVSTEDTCSAKVTEATVRARVHRELGRAAFYQPLSNASDPEATRTD